MNFGSRPSGILEADFEGLHAAGCIQTGADVASDLDEARNRFEAIFVALMIHTQGNPCDGCPAWNGGKCTAFLKYHTQAETIRRLITPRQSSNSRFTDLRESHRQFAERDRLFRRCCELADIKPTKRQAAKFRDGRGTAIRFKKEAQAQISLR